MISVVVAAVLISFENVFPVPPFPATREERSCLEWMLLRALLARKSRPLIGEASARGKQMHVVKRAPAIVR